MRIVLADDLTGATDTGIQFRKNGMQTLVMVDGCKAILKERDNCTALAINMSSRELNGPDAYEKTSEIIRKLDIRRNDLVYKKVDSLMRGNPVEELDAVLFETRRKLAILAPSFPAAGRLVDNGILLMPDGTSKNLISLFQDKSRYPVCPINTGLLRRGKKELIQRMQNVSCNMIYLFDSSTEKDLKLVAELVAEFLADVVFCGSAGLAKEIAACQAPQKENVTFSKGKILVVTGSRKKETANQIQEIKKRYGLGLVIMSTQKIVLNDDPDVSRAAANEVKQKLQENEAGVILTLDSLFDNQTGFMDGDPLTKEEGNIISQSIRRVMETVDPNIFGALIIVGGDTALSVCKAFRATQIRLLDEVQSGVPMGILMDGKAKGTPIITKSGALGDKDTLVRVIEFLYGRWS